MAAHTDRWYFTRERLQNTPSRKCGVEPEKELSYRQQAANLIQDMGQRLQVNQLCINTSIVYMHRFYMFHSFTRFPRNSIAAACLFLAAKVEEQPHKLEHVIKVAHLCLHRGGPSLDTKSDTYLQQAQELVINESVILQTFAFHVAVGHPHTHVVKCTQMIRASKDLAQTSYFMATNSLHLTTFCLQYKPTIVSCVCVHLACKWSQYEIPKSSDGNYWWEYVDPNVTKGLLDELTMEFLQIIEACPNRLKRRIAIHKQQAAAVKQGCKDSGSEDGDLAGLGGMSDWNEDFKNVDFPSHTGSPWLSKLPKQQLKIPDVPLQGQSSRSLAEKMDLTESAQPAKKSLEEYRQQKERERKQSEQKHREEKIKHEKRRAYEEAQRREKAARDAKLKRSKVVPAGQGKSSQSGSHHGSHPYVKHPQGKIIPHGMPVVDKRHRPVPNVISHTPHTGKPPYTHPQKKSHATLLPPPPPPHSKDGRPNIHHKANIKGPPSVKSHRSEERKTEERKTEDMKYHVSGYKPQPEYKRPTSPLVSQKQLVKKEPPTHKPEVPSLLHKVHVSQGKSQPHQDVDSRINDEFSDLRDEIMRDLENDTFGDTSGNVSHNRPRSVPVTKKRNSLENLQQVAREELLNFNKSVSSKSTSELQGSSSRASASVGTSAAVDKKPNISDASNNGLKSGVRLKDESKHGPYHQPHSSVHVSPSKKLKSPLKVKKEPSKVLKISQTPVAIKTEILPVMKKRRLDMAQIVSPDLRNVDRTDINQIQMKKGIKVEPGHLLMDSLVSSASNISQTSGAPAIIKKEKEYFVKMQDRLAVATAKCIAEKDIQKGLEARKLVYATKATEAEKAHQELKKMTGVSIHKASISVDRTLKEVVPLVPTVKKAEPPLVASRQPAPVATVISTDLFQPIESGTINVLPELKSASELLSSAKQRSPKHKHRNKDKKKHKKHRQDKPPIESSKSPNVESTSIVTPSGGIKLKIKGLSSSFSGGSPEEQSKPSSQETLSNSVANASLKLKINSSSPSSGKEKEHKHKQKHVKSKSHRKDVEVHNRKRTSSPSVLEATPIAVASPVKRKAAEAFSSQSELPGSQSLLSLPMPPPDPKKIMPSKHSSGRHKSKKRSKSHLPDNSDGNKGNPPPPPPTPDGPPPTPPPPPPCPLPGTGSSSPLTTVTALPSMDAMSMDQFNYPNQYHQYYPYQNMMLPSGNGRVPHPKSTGNMPQMYPGQQPPPQPPYS